MSRSYNDELQFLDKLDKNCWRIKKGFVPNMHVGAGTGEEQGKGGPAVLTALSFSLFLSLFSLPPAGGGCFLRERPSGEADVRGAAQRLPRGG